MSQKVAITGIKPTGLPHLGNYFGAIEPGLRLAREHQTFFFLADFHALNTTPPPGELRRLTLEVAAAWLASGLDVERSVFYRQSDVPEVFELFSILANVTAKGLMNRAHAYKAAVAQNQEQGRERDEGINMGLYNYPILMAADILLFAADVVPVGQDQLQHVEITRDIAQAFNRLYGDILRVPEAIQSEAPLLPGLDGRKMSKSYDNAIPLFVSGAQLKKLVRQYKTDSTPVDAPKNPERSDLYQLYRLVATPEEAAGVRGELLAGRMGWSALKDLLSTALERFFAPGRERYQELLAHPVKIEEVLQEGAARARQRARETLLRVRDALGLGGRGGGPQAAEQKPDIQPRSSHS